MAKSLMGGSSRQKDAQTSNVPDVPKTCHKQGCNNDCDLIMAKVSSGKGIEIKPASDVMTWTTLHGTTIFNMNSNYNFLAWFSRCSPCLMSGMQHKKAKLRSLGENPLYL